jgi:hypothetical protein
MQSYRHYNGTTNRPSQPNYGAIYASVGGRGSPAQAKKVADLQNLLGNLCTWDGADDSDVVGILAGIDADTFLGQLDSLFFLGGAFR